MTSLEDLPDELLEPIIKSLDLYQKCHIDLDILRRLSLPILFRKVSIRIVDKVERFQRLMKALEHNMHLMPLIRELSVRESFQAITSEEAVTLLIDVLSRCTGLEHLDLPRHRLGSGNLRPIIEALNNHPSDNIHLQLMSVVCGDPESLNNLRSISLSRVICQEWEWSECSDQEMKTLLAQGLSIQSIWRDQDIHDDDSWMDMTYPGLTKIYWWNGNERSLQSTIDFLLRHPLLEKIELRNEHECDMTPWHVAFASKLYPYSFKIARPEFINSSYCLEVDSSVVKIGGEWLYKNVKIIFQSAISHGDVETVETMVRALGEALPHSPDCPRLSIGIDFLSPVGEFLTSDDLIGILVRNMSHAGILNLGNFVCDILTRECYQIDIFETDWDVGEGLIPGFDSFCKRLMQAMPRLYRVLGRSSWGRLLQVEQ
ncbi:hypothetical protein K435DRAFT_916773 [Dendrothele bispora CBS 962.96]|uniref:F-box domain-containing protein n=1 Tax=Dendrothele bispora (strain CBS 962.96) TaxID=1314807 RepID=A0A4S8MKQ1_DENBC|nr:hypothetical protein K435DRAFT_916773 [Dendrothele bispora CBS 962.96]